MKITKKKWIITAVLLLVILMEVGCMRTKEAYKSLSDSAIDFLEKKYSRDFSLLTYEAGDVLSDIDYVHCVTDGIDTENEDVVVAVLEENGEIILQDNYFFYLIRPEMEGYVADVVREEFDEVKVYVENDEFFSNSLTADSSLEDFYRVEDSYRMSVNIFIKGDSAMPEEELEKKVQHIEETLVSSGHSYMVYLFIVSPDMYNSIERYQQEGFWDFYIDNREPDGNTYYYGYCQGINGGGE